MVLALIVQAPRAMALDTYRRKRDLDVTPEPPARVQRPSREPIFVVQEHHATRLHYDFRLEADGVLKSWAVTKEPTLDPSVRRLAVQVEDHPVAYAGFAGDIPAGHYGAGHVDIWDNGHFEPLGRHGAPAPRVADALRDGHLEFRLHGQKLAGRFALIQMKARGGKNWLLLKLKDDKARPGTAPASPPDGQKVTAKAPRRQPSAPQSPPPTATARRPRPPAEVELTHPDRIMFPEGGFTKQDLFAYYDRVADRLLPHLRGRPVTLERLPDGVGGAANRHFWQKDTPASYPAWIERAELTSVRGEPVRYVLVNDRATLLYLVNQGTVTFHPWASRMADLDRPDLVSFDLDPGERPFADAVRAAHAVRAALLEAGSEAYVKTSGKTGLHVLAPWAGRGGHDEARAWALEIAGRVIEAHPDLATLERSKNKRGGRLYLDVMQNARGHHLVPPYVV
ncbi:MAG TPA: DNA polymerase ligase N-terminal domain-containing protein, partial [Polyangiaceae bacterium]|nr:DNA polymerase ligase N-terminal domain-containing protein [Polyangiaceae bacterium]